MTNEEWLTIMYFKSEEFDSPDIPNSGTCMNFHLIKVLDLIRENIGRPIKINSGYRTPEHNKEVGGVSDSPHLQGFAVDIHCPDSSFRYKFITYALTLGITRIGIGKTFIHIDIQPSKSPNIIWVY